jgi:orotate phosphoribosyltransferase
VTPQPERVLDLFEQTGAWLQGHFRLSSGLHSSGYLQSALVLKHPEHAEDLGRRLAAMLPGDIDFVISPALGGMIIGHEVARALKKPFLFTERDADRKMALRRGFALRPGSRAIVIEDVITTGGSTKEVIDILRAADVIPVGAGSIIDRSGGTADVGIPRVALETLTVPTFAPEECPLCAAGQTVVKPGSRPV